MVNGETELDYDFRTHYDRVGCFNAMSLEYEDRCDFINRARSCDKARFYVPFIDLFHCNLRVQSRLTEVTAVVCLGCLCLYVVLIIATVADSYFGPALKVVSKVLRMNEHLAGVTLLAFGNSSADFFANIGSKGSESPLYANCLSGAIFVTMVAGGIVCFIRPFKLNGHATTRDVLFFMAGILTIEYTIMNDGVISRNESVCYILIYVFYIIVNVIDVYLMKRDLEKNEKTLKTRKRGSSKADDIKLKKRLTEQRRITNFEFVRRSQESGSSKSSTSSRLTFTTRVSRQRETFDASTTRNVLHNKNNPKNKFLFREFFESLKPFHFYEWRAASKLMKLFMLIRAPILFVTQLYIPIVDAEADKHGWSKLLNCIQIIINPTLALLVSMDTKYIDHVIYSFAVTVPLAIFVFLHARTDKPPFYHFFFTTMSCAGSMVLIYVCASEISIMLNLIGITLSFTEGFCGATIASWGGCVGDLVANIVMALHGYEGMAFAACFGGPFFNTLLSAGVVYCLESWNSPTGKVPVLHGDYGLNTFIFLMLALSTTLIWSSILNFQARRSVGVFNLILYTVFVVFAILCEKEVIHNFSDDSVLKIV